MEAVDWMNQRKLQFETLDVLSNPQAFARMREISGQSLTPTLELPNGQVLPDFDTVQLEDFLKKHQLLS